MTQYRVTIETTKPRSKQSVFMQIAMNLPEMDTLLQEMGLPSLFSRRGRSAEPVLEDIIFNFDEDVEDPLPLIEAEVSQLPGYVRIASWDELRELPSSQTIETPSEVATSSTTDFSAVAG